MPPNVLFKAMSSNKNRQCQKNRKPDVGAPFKNLQIFFCRQINCIVRNEKRSDIVSVCFGFDF